MEQLLGCPEAAESDSAPVPSSSQEDAVSGLVSWWALPFGTPPKEPKERAPGTSAEKSGERCRDDNVGRQGRIVKSQDALSARPLASGSEKKPSSCLWGCYGLFSDVACSRL